MAHPVTKAGRLAQIAAILAAPGATPVHSQEDLAARLDRIGVHVTQATLSRDLVELGAVRLRGPDGALAYSLPAEPLIGLAPHPDAAPQPDAPPQPDAAPTAPTAPTAPQAAPQAARLARVAGELLVTAEASGNLVVIRTPAGAAQLLASAIDHSGWPSILGTVGGDDTVLVISRDPAGGAELATALLRLAERRSQAGLPP
jgi:transcriptional regulator of arginine metabolism